jgi:hypothetical protein
MNLRNRSIWFWIVMVMVGLALLSVLVFFVQRWIGPEASEAAVAASATTLKDVALKGPIDKGGRAEIATSSGRIQGTPVNRYRWGVSPDFGALLRKTQDRAAPGRGRIRPQRRVRSRGKTLGYHGHGVSGPRRDL